MKGMGWKETLDLLQIPSSVVLVPFSPPNRNESLKSFMLTCFFEYSSNLTFGRIICLPLFEPYDEGASLRDFTFFDYYLSYCF